MDRIIKQRLTQWPSKQNNGVRAPATSPHSKPLPSTSPTTETTTPSSSAPTLLAASSGKQIENIPVRYQSSQVSRIPLAIDPTKSIGG